jgi:hypothetical protein
MYAKAIRVVWLRWGVTIKTPESGGDGAGRNLKITEQSQIVFVIQRKPPSDVGVQRKNDDG